MEENLLQQISDNPDLAKDPVSGAVININRNAYQNAINAHKRQKMQEQKLTSLESDINSVKGELTEIKKLLINLIEDRT